MSTPRDRAMMLTRLLPPLGRYVVRGWLDDLTDAEVVSWAQTFRLLADWVCSAQQHHSQEDNA